MTSGNAFGFLALGFVMWVLPLVAPTWFPHLAVDGSSTRALWLQTMGIVQMLVGAGYFIRELRTVMNGSGAYGPQRGAVATADWHPEGLPQGVVAVDFAAEVAAEPVPAVVHAAPEAPVTLRGRRAALWRVIEQAWAKEERIEEFLIRAGRRRLELRARAFPSGGTRQAPPRESSRRHRATSGWPQSMHEAV